MVSRRNISTDEAAKTALKNELGVTNLEDNQTVGYLAYSTYAELPTVGTLNYSYKVTNDSDSSLNGYYHWSGSAYVKDAGLYDEFEDQNEAQAIQLLRLHNPNLSFIGFADTSTATPSHASTNAWIISESGTVFGTADCVQGQVIYSDGAAFVVEDMSREMYPLRQYHSKLNEGIIDVYINGSKISGREYSIYLIRRNYSGEWTIRLSNEVVINDSTPSIFSILSEFSTTTSPENGDSVTVHKLSEYSGSGVTAYVAINWSKFNDSQHLNMWAGKGYSLVDNVFDLENTRYLSNYFKSLSNQLPFDNGIVANSELKAAIKSMLIEGYTDAEPLLIETFQRNNGGYYRVRIGKPDGTDVLFWSDDSYIEPDAVDGQILDTIIHNENGITLTITIDWAQVTTPLIGGNEETALLHKTVSHNFLNTITEEKINTKVSSYIHYPFSGTQEDLNSELIAAIKDFEVYGYMRNNSLYIGRVDRDESNKWYIYLYENDGSTNTLLCGFILANMISEPASGNIYIAESTNDFSSEGISFKCWIDWSQISVGKQLFSLSEGSLSDVVYKNKSVFIDSEISQAEKDAANALNIAFSESFKNRNIVGLQKLTADYNHILIYGQSVAVGGGQAISLTPYKNTKMIGSSCWIKNATGKTALNSLIADSVNNDENLIIQAAYSFKDLLDSADNGDKDKCIVATAAGYGGVSIELLSKSNPVADYYEDQFIEAITCMQSIATLEGKTVACPAIVFLQGEANMTENANQNWDGTGAATNDKEEYKSYLTQLFSDMVDEIKSTYGQSADPLIILYVTRNNAGDYLSYIQQAQIEYAQENYNACIFSPTYFLTTNDSDSTHPTANGYRWLGEYVAKALYSGIVQQKKHLFVHPRKITKGLNSQGNNFVDVHFYAPSPPLRKNTETTPAVSEDGLESLGFMVYDNGVEMSMSSVELYSTFVRITLSAVNRFTSEFITVSYADSKNSGNGNLCDSEDFPAKSKFVSGVIQDTRIPNDINGDSILNEPYPLYNFCVPFSYTLNGVDELEIVL